jgi:membrane protein implicated in regulation of membrane protease activity
VLLVLAIVGLFFIPDPWRVVLLVCAAVVEVAEVYFWIHFLRRYRVTTGVEGMIGKRGEVIARCDPVGRVRVHGEIWSARSSDTAEVGETVSVTAVDGLTLLVEPRARAAPVEAGG